MATSVHRILIVDDYPEAADTTCALLGLLGHACQPAVCGHDAIEAARAFAPNIVILDIGLPDVSGYEVARQLRADAPGRAMYIAALTGWGHPHDRARAIAAGFDQHVLKPANFDKLRGIIARAERNVVAALAPLAPVAPVTR